MIGLRYPDLRIQQAMFETGHSAWSAGWLLGLSALAPLAGLVSSESL
jgi:hypothetical protein